MLQPIPRSGTAARDDAETVLDPADQEVPEEEEDLSNGIEILESDFENGNGSVENANGHNGDESSGSSRWVTVSSGSQPKTGRE